MGITKAINPKSKIKITIKPSNGCATFHEKCGRTGRLWRRSEEESVKPDELPNVLVKSI